MSILPQVLIAFVISGVIVALARWRGWLSVSGGLCALVIGTLVLGFGGWAWAILLGVFFVSSSVLSRFKSAEKRKAAEKFDKGNKRDGMQVLANGGLGALIAVAGYIWPSELWFGAFLGVMAAVNADTWATELGTLSKQSPRLITTGKVVEVGTSGAVSGLGTLVSFVGGWVIGAVAGVLGSNAWWVLSLVGALSGLAGSLFDSLLGATIQQIYFCPICDKDTEKRMHGCGTPTEHLRGWQGLNNDLVNLFASMVGGVFAVICWLIVGI